MISWIHGYNHYICTLDHSDGGSITSDSSTRKHCGLYRNC